MVNMQFFGSLQKKRKKDITVINIPIEFPVIPSKNGTSCSSTETMRYETKQCDMNSADNRGKV